jgi:hypothetical protein
VAAEDEGGDVLHRDFELERQEVAEARAVENARHADDHVVREPREFAQRPDHRVERVGDADDEGVRRMGLDPFAHGLHDLEVDADEVVAAHARLAGDAGGDDADVRARDVGVGIRAGERRVEPFGGSGFGDVERLALRRAFGDVEEDDVAELLECREVGERSADLSRADEGDFRSGHVRTPVRWFCAMPSP